MRRFISISMVVLFVLTIITGIAESHVHPGSSGIHTVLSFLFLAFTFTHILLNRKSLARYLALSSAKAKQS